MAGEIGRSGETWRRCGASPVSQNTKALRSREFTEFLTESINVLIEQIERQTSLHLCHLLSKQWREEWERRKLLTA